MSTVLLNELLAISELMRRDMSRAFAGTALTESRVAVLWTLQSRGTSTQKDVADALGVSGKNVSVLVDALEGAGYVRRTAHPTDRRAVLLEMTESARRLMRTMENEHLELARTLVSAIAPGDVAAVERGVSAVAARLRHLVDEAEGASR
jgi:DNA-binding MarR family transcriptional regulator